MNHIDTKNPKVGVGVIVKKDEKVLLGKRKNAYGNGTWSFPGGHLEFGETVEDCSRREVLEEAGVEIHNIIPVTLFTEDISEKEQKHYITLFVTSEYLSGEVRVVEPDRCEEWRWFDWNNLPRPLFSPILKLVDLGYSPYGA